MVEAANKPGATIGWLGFATGAVALMLTIVLFWAGPFAPQQSAGVGLGELVADIAKSAIRSAAGQPQPEPVALVRDIDDYLTIAVSLLSGLAIVLGIASFIRHERKRVAYSGIALGGLAVGFHLFTWTIMMIVGGLVIMSLIYSLRDAFGDLFSA